MNKPMIEAGSALIGLIGCMFASVGLLASLLAGRVPAIMQCLLAVCFGIIIGFFVFTWAMYIVWFVTRLVRRTFDR